MRLLFQSLRQTLEPGTVVRALDVTRGDAAGILEQLIAELGGVIWCVEGL
jgi:hypothetical protein